MNDIYKLPDKMESGVRYDEVMDRRIKEIICIGCPMGCSLKVEVTGDHILVEGNQCKRGEAFAKNEIENPTRSLTTTVRTIFEEMPLLPVRTEGEIPKDKVFQAMEVLNKVIIKDKVSCGDIILKDILHSGCNVVATSTIDGGSISPALEKVTSSTLEGAASAEPVNKIGVSVGGEEAL
ncbi:MAG: DUF1667 domain-containing protein [Clostridium sp.]